MQQEVRAVLTLSFHFSEGAFHEKILLVIQIFKLYRTLNKILHFYWFSGSGNTLRAVEVFAERLRELGWTVELRPIERYSSENEIDIDPTAIFGLGFPTHCFSIPEIVRNFVRRLPTVSHPSAVMLGTHGAFSGGVLGPMKQLLCQKGFHCVAGKIISMPDSFFPFFGDETNRRQLDRALGNARRYADRFDDFYCDNKTRWPRWPVLSDIHGFLFGTFFSSRKLVRSLHTTVHANADLCIRCGTCVRSCPVKALEFETSDSVPTPNRDCTNCLRCVAVCPVDAMRHMIGFRPYRSAPAEQLYRRFEQEIGEKF